MSENKAKNEWTPNSEIKEKKKKPEIQQNRT